MHELHRRRPENDDSALTSPPTYHHDERHDTKAASIGLDVAPHRDQRNALVRFRTATQSAAALIKFHSPKVENRRSELINLTTQLPCLYSLLVPYRLSPRLVLARALISTTCSVMVVLPSMTVAQIPLCESWRYWQRMWNSATSRRHKTPTRGYDRRSRGSR